MRALRQIVLAVLLPALGLCCTGKTPVATVAEKLKPAESPAKEPAADPLREAVLAAKTSKQAGLAHKAFFAEKDHDELRALAFDPDAGIALQAAWRAFNRMNPQRFIGFLEARVGVRVPLDWEASLIEFTLREKDPKLLETAGWQHKSLMRASKQVVDPGAFDYVDTDLGLKGRQGTRLWAARGRVDQSSLTRD